MFRDMTYASRCGGETGIRTLDTASRIADFESAPFDHSGISPDEGKVILFFPEKVLLPAQNFFLSLPYKPFLQGVLWY